MGHSVTVLTTYKKDDDSNIIITDIGDVQKEAFFNKVHCITLRDETKLDIFEYIEVF